MDRAVLSDLKAKMYPVSEFEGNVIGLEEAKEIKRADIIGAYIGIFEEDREVIETMIRIDEENGEVWGKCTCKNYLIEPCSHIISLYHIIKEKEEEEEEEIEEDEKGKEGEGRKEELTIKPNSNKITKETPEEGRQKAILKVKNQELELIKRADDLDEELIIKEHIAGTTPLVFKIPTKQGERYELSIRGWTQAMLLQGDIEVEDVKFEKIGDRVIAKAYVVDKRRNVRAIGIAERVTNKEFYYTTLASKAIRNALKKVISPKYEQEVIKQALEAKLFIELKLEDLREATSP